MVTKRLKEQPAGQILRLGALGLHFLTMAAILTLAACASPPPHYVVQPAVTPPPPLIEVYFYPTKGQSKAQQDRDRYECYLWAMEQTGFDPSAPQLAPHQRVRIEPAIPPGQETKAGAITGAVLGAATSEHGKETEGAIKGAIAGAIIGAASESARHERTKRLEERIEAEHSVRIEQQANSYRRAMAACLKGRGYEVR